MVVNSVTYQAPALQIVLDKTQLDRVRTEKQKAKKKSGDFTDADEDEKDNGEGAP